MRRELAATNSEAIVIIVDIGDVVLVFVNEIFFVDFQIKQVMSNVVIKDIIDSRISRFEFTVKSN